MQIQEKKRSEESKVAVELRKHYDALKKKTESLARSKSDLEGQLKALLSNFLTQRKALELSIAKNKRLEEELAGEKGKYDVVDVKKQFQRHID